MSAPSDKQANTQPSDQNSGLANRAVPESSDESKPVEGSETRISLASLNLEKLFANPELDRLSDEELGINAQGSERFWEIPTVNARRHIMGEAEDAFKEYEDKD